MDKSKMVESHEPQFTGWWIPADVVTLYQTKKITTHEMILLAKVDSLVRRGVPGQPGHGCYATNRWLAAEIGLKNGQSVHNMITKLKKMGLLLELHDTGSETTRRYLETKWSRVYLKG